MHAPEASAATRTACARVVAALPGHVADQPRRTVDDDRQGAAWGDPAIVLRCGVGKPAGSSFAPCQEVDGLGWSIPEKQLTKDPDHVTMTTIGRSPRVEVTVPRDYLPPAAAMVDLARPLLAATKRTGACQ